jgi:hypothetical protein
MIILVGFGMAGKLKIFLIPINFGYGNDTHSGGLFVLVEKISAMQYN